MGPYSHERKNLGLLLWGLCMLVWLDALFSHRYFMLSWCVLSVCIGILNTMSGSFLGRTTPPHIDITVIEVRQCTILLTLLLWTAERRDFPVFCALIEFSVTQPLSDCCTSDLFQYAAQNGLLYTVLYLSAQKADAWESEWCAYQTLIPFLLHWHEAYVPVVFWRQLLQIMHEGCNPSSAMYWECFLGWCTPQ